MPLDASHIEVRLKQGWEMLRTLQHSPTLAIKRLGYTGQNAAKGVMGTPSDTGIGAEDCTWADLSVEEKEAAGIAAQSAVRRFVVYDLSKDAATFTVRLSDKVLYPETDAHALWNIVKENTFPSGRVEILAEKERSS